MILELADIRIHPGQQAAFDEAIQRGVNEVISNAVGFQGYKVNKGSKARSATFCKFFGKRLKTTPSTSGSRLRSRNGVRLWANFLQSHRRLSTLSCWPSLTESSPESARRRGMCRCFCDGRRALRAINRCFQ